MAYAICSGAPVCAAQAAQPTGVELTSVAQIRERNAQGLTGVSARISGQITYVDGLRSLFLQDSTGGILVQNPGVDVELQRGQRIEVVGEVTRGGAAPAITGIHIRMIDPAANSPFAEEAASDALTSSRFQYRFVELKGIVRVAIEDQESHARGSLKVLVDGHEIEVSIRDIIDADYRRLVDAVIRIRGVLCVYENARGVPVIYRLVVQSMDDVSTLEPAPRLSDMPVVTVSSIQPQQHRIRLHGAVRLGGTGLILQDATGSISLTPMEQSDLRPAANEDLVAFVAERHGQRVLVEGQAWRTELAREGRSATASRPPALLTTVRQIRQLPDTELPANRKVQLEGVVTYFDPSVRDTFIQDATGGIFVFAPTGGKLHLKAGDLVKVEGFANAGGFGPVITEPRVKVLGARPLPDPLRIDMEEILTGKADSQLVEARGTVRSARPEAGHLRLEIAWGSHRYLASVAGTDRIPAGLLNARVRLTGVCGAITNFKHQFLEVELNVPDLTYIQPDSAAHFAQLPLQRIDQILQYSARANGDDQVRIQGKVVFTNPSGPTYLSDFSGDILIRTHAFIRLNPGDWVQASGTARSGAFAPFLRDAQLSKVAVLDPPQARPETYDTILQRGRDAEFVRIEGYLVNDTSGAEEQSLLLQAGGNIFEGRLLRGRLPALTKGSLLRISGLTSLRVDESAQILAPIGFSILLRSPADIQILETSTWWTTQRLQNAGWGVLALVLAAVLWILGLRRQVGLQTQQLRLANAELQQLSSRDSLTGIANRRKFDESLETECRRARESTSTLSLLMVDIDFFKALNDHYGHQRGDECLIEVVRALQSVPLRVSDVLARYGGEEFALILPGTDLAGTRAVAERLRIAVRERQIPHVRSPFDQTVSISVGAAVMEPHELISPEDLIRLADRALYRSKDAGRNRVTALKAAQELVGCLAEAG